MEPKLLVVGEASIWRERAVKRLIDHGVHLACVEDLCEAFACVRDDTSFKCVLIRDDHEDHVVLSAIAKMMMVRPDLEFIFLAEDGNSDSMAKYLELGQRDDGRFAVRYVPTTYDYGALQNLVDDRLLLSKD